MLKAKAVAEKWGLNVEAFSSFLEKQKQIETGGYLSTTIREEDEEKAVALFKNYLQQKKQEEEARIKAQQDAAIAKQKAEWEARERAERKKQALASMLVTSGFNFDGYTIKRYSGYISGDDAIQINRNELFAGQGQHLTDALVRIRIQALKELKEAAYDLGCNAVIGVDFDYMTFEPENIVNNFGNTTHFYEPYVVCVTANGNAVVIEKN